MRILKILFCFFGAVFANSLEENILNMPARKEFILNETLSKYSKRENLNIDFKVFLNDNLFLENNLNLDKEHTIQNRNFYNNNAQETINSYNHFAVYKADDGSYTFAGYQPMDIFFSSTHSANGIKIHGNKYEFFTLDAFAFNGFKTDNSKTQIVGILASANIENLRANSSFARFGKIADIWALEVSTNQDILGIDLKVRTNISESKPNEFHAFRNDFERSKFLGLELGADFDFLEVYGGYLNYGKKDAKSLHSFDQNGKFIKAGSELLDYSNVSGKHNAYFTRAKIKNDFYSFGIDYVKENVKNNFLPNQNNDEIVANAGFAPFKDLSFNFLYSLSHKKEQNNKNKKNKFGLDASYNF